MMKTSLKIYSMKILKSFFSLVILFSFLVSFSACTRGGKTTISDSSTEETIVSDNEESNTEIIQEDTTIVERKEDASSEEPEEIVALEDEITQTPQQPTKPTPKPKPIVKKPKPINVVKSNTTTTSKPKPTPLPAVPNTQENNTKEEIFTSKGGNKINVRQRQLDERIIEKAASKYNFKVTESISPTTQSGKAIFNLKGTVSGADLPSDGFVVRVFRDNVRSYHKGSHLVRMPLPVMMSKSGGHQFNTSFEFKALPGTYYYTVEPPTKNEVLHFGKFEVK